MNIKLNIKDINLRQKVVSIFRRNKPAELQVIEEEALEENTGIDDLVNYVSNRIVGQDDAVKTLISNILYNQLLLNELEEQGNTNLTDLESRKISILLEGPTGTGKSSIINDIASKISIPVSIANITRFFEADFSLNELFYDLLLKADGHLNFAERGIVVIDEIDKIANNSNYSIPAARKFIQEEILALMSGDIYQFDIPYGDNTVPISFDTSKLTFVICGDFSKAKDKMANNAGFIKTSDKGYISNDIIPGFFKKIKVVANTKKYNVEDYKNILLHSEISPLNSLVGTFKKFDYENVKYDNGLVQKLANDAYDMGVGARGLQILVSEVQNQVLYNIITEKYNKDEEIKLTKDLLEGGRQRVRK